MNYSIVKNYPVVINYGDVITGFNCSVFGRKVCNVYLFSSANSDFLEIESFTGNLKIILAATSETGIPAAIVAGRQGSFVASTDTVNDPQWVQYEIDAVALTILLEATFDGVCGGYAKDDVWYSVDMGESTALFGTVAFFGDSRTYLATSKGRIDWGMFFSGGALRTTDVFNFGIISDKTTDLLARIQDVIDAEPDVVHLCVGINDLEGSSDSVATIYANYSQIVTELNAVGIAVSGERIAPVLNPVANREADRIELNALIASNEKLMGVCGEDYDINPATDFYDGVHYNGRGAIIRGKSMGAILKTLSKNQDVYSDTSDKLNSNNHFNLVGTGGADYRVAGDIANELYILCSSTEVNATASKGTLNGYESQVVQLTRVGSGESGSLAITNHPSFPLNTNATIGERVELIVDIKIDTTDGFKGLTVGSNSKSYSYTFGGTTEFDDVNNVQGIGRTSSVSLTSAVTTEDFDVLRVQFGSGDVDIRIEIARPYARKVI